ncbi:DUF1254 domain-containing protein [Pseudomonas sp. GV071]|uniref:DUF1254 domain-containing protein n=1 Tax=Pseudomonas sp. GV071 TaxID=2135754 RepID=UPI000D47D733|nr:DUF1254 domain-containing protein [Pseudomonas sp. GV071]PTQ69898.1 hypothetical protein C8K61_107108 [Pseudomonas sp. GV071]
MKSHALLAFCFGLAFAVVARAEVKVEPLEAEAIAKEAYIYGYPMLEMYKTLYIQAIDTESTAYQAPLNRIAHNTDVYNGKTTAVQSPIPDTRYSFAWLDLRAEPIILTLPAVDSERYFSVQLSDIFTQNFAYLGSRTTGSKGGRYLIAGPDWQGPTPENVDEVVRSESSLVYALYRTQLFDARDMAKMRQVQQGYTLQTLSRYLKLEARPTAAKLDWPVPSPDPSPTPDVFRLIDFLLQFAPPHPTEVALRRRLARIGINSDQPFYPDRLTANQYNALQAGINDARAEFATFKSAEVDSGQIPTTELFGDREHLANNYLARYAGAAVGLFAASAEEANFIGYFNDEYQRPLNGIRTRYSLHFGKDQLPPVDAFWSLTLYDANTQLLIDNRLNRYLVNSRMLDRLQRDPDGGLTLHLQRLSPGIAMESNWLPVPPGPFYGVLRLYEPKPEVANGQWKPPAITVLP